MSGFHESSPNVGLEEAWAWRSGGRSRRRARNIGGEAWSGYGSGHEFVKGCGTVLSGNRAPGATFAIVLSPALRRLERQQIPVDFGKTAVDYAQHRAGFPDRVFDRPQDMEIIQLKLAQGVIQKQIRE